MWRRAASIPTTRRARNRRIGRAALDGSLRLFYAAPERLLQPKTADFLKRCGVNLLAVDEAHCVSQWGHDFRPEYLQLRELRTALGGPQAIAFTATADRRHPRRYRGAPVRRPAAALRHGVRPPEHPPRDGGEERRRRPRSPASLPHMKAKAASSIAGRATRTEELARALCAAGHDAAPYHAGLTIETRADAQDPLSARGRSHHPSPPSPSAWGSTSPTCASSATPTCPRTSRAGIRRSAAPGATACPLTR